MKKIICLLIVAFTFPSMQVLADFGPPPGAEEFTKKTIQLFSNGQIDEAISMLEPSMLPDNPLEIGSTINNYLTSIGPNPKISLVNWWGMKSFTTNFRATELVYHVVGKTKAALIFARVEVSDNGTTLKYFNVQKAPLNLMDRYPFVLFGISFFHYIFLVLVIVIPLFMAYSAYIAIRVKLKRRWLWAIFSFVGIGQVTLFWLPGPITSQMLKFKLLAIKLLGFGIAKAPIYDPWYLTTTVPIGALIVFLKVRSKKKKAELSQSNNFTYVSEDNEQAEISHI